MLKSFKIESKKKNSFDKINFENYLNTFKNNLKSQEITKNLIENLKNPKLNEKKKIKENEKIKTHIK